VGVRAHTCTFISVAAAHVVRGRWCVQVAVPELVAKTLTYPERVFEHNLVRLRAHVRSGPDVHPGANYVVAPDGRKTYAQPLFEGASRGKAKTHGSHAKGGR
jgi:DNA-directed RNA polymerase beta' subunit